MDELSIAIYSLEEKKHLQEKKKLHRTPGGDCPHLSQVWSWVSGSEQPSVGVEFVSGERVPQLAGDRSGLVK